MLKQRIITATILLIVLIPIIFYPSPVPFVCLILLISALAGWEWGKLCQLNFISSIFLGLFISGLTYSGRHIETFRHPKIWFWLLAIIFWLIFAGFLLKGGINFWNKFPKSLKIISGILAIWLASLGIILARTKGIEFLLSILTLVWIADIFAYFGGRAFGQKFIKRKLAPSLSPGKTWEGVFVALIGTFILAGFWLFFSNFENKNLFNLIYQKNLVLLIFAILILTIFSIIGDLIESLIKRSANVKDSSNLLPGHGGILDRIDALLPTFPLAMFLAQINQIT